MAATGRSFATVSGRPELAPLVARWLLDAFGHPGSRNLDEMVARILAPPEGPEESFVLFEGDQPAGTASLEQIAEGPEGPEA